LQTFSRANSLYNSNKQLNILQLVTWNDYEEGTEIESGIDNCVSVSASVSGNSLNWGVSGQENTVDHYTPYISLDGQNLMPLNDLASGLHTTNMCSYSLAAGNYTLYVQAVGKPSLRNQISGSIRYSTHCSTTAAATGTTKIALAASPSAATISSGQSANTNVTATSASGSFDNPVFLSCSNLPNGMTCSFAPSTLTPESGSGSSVLTVSTASVSAASRPLSSRHGRMPITAGWFALGIAGLALFDSRKKRINRSRIASFVVGLTFLLTSCGGGGQSSSVTPVSRKNYSITINGVSGTIQASTTATITIQ